MTNQEAINLLEKTRPKDNNAISLMLNEALNKAIKALEQEPSGDAISRESVKAYKYHRTMYPNFEDYVDMLPSINPQKPNKTGHWTIKQYQVPIKNKQVPTIAYTALSSIEPTACKIVYTYSHSFCKSEEYLNKYSYCPNCGVKMEE